MKILLTGASSRQWKHVHPEEQYFSVMHALSLALAELGHDVDWRKVQPGDDLSGYDVAVLGFHSFGSMACKLGRYGVAWAAAQLPHVIALQDWRLSTVFQHLRNSEYFWGCAHLGAKDMEVWHKAHAHVKLMERVRDSWSYRIRAVLAPMFDWGDHEGLRRFHRIDHIHTWDVDAFYEPNETYGPPSYEHEREREWIVVSLSDVSEWFNKLNPSWKVLRRWPDNSKRGKGGGIARDEALTFIPEKQIVLEHMHRAWGVMLPGYIPRMTLSGWWRNRFKLAWSRNCVLYTDELNGMRVGDAYQLRLEEIENMDDNGLIELVSAQRSAHTCQAPNRSEVLRRIAQALDSATEPIR